MTIQLGHCTIDLDSQQVLWPDRVEDLTAGECTLRRPRNDPASRRARDCFATPLSDVMTPESAGCRASRGRQRLLDADRSGSQAPPRVMRLRVLWGLTFALSGCVQPDQTEASERRPGVSQETVPVATTTSPEADVEVVALCSDTDNPLRQLCEVSLSEALPLVFRYGADAEDRVLTFGPSSVHVFTVTGLMPETWFSYTAEAGGSSASGAFRSGEVVGLPGIEVTGTATFDYVLFAHDDVVIIAATTGEVVWFEVFDEEGAGPQKGRITGTTWVEEGVGLGIASSLYEVGLDGTRRFASHRGVGHDLPLHHDVFIRDGLRYVVNAQQYTYGDHDFVIDGFYVFDDGGVVGEWHLADHLESDPVWTGSNLGFWSHEWPGAEDYAHANAVFATDDGTILFSARRLNRVFAIAGVHAGNFGEILWTLDGQVGGDFQIVGSPDGLNDVDGQHHPQLVGDQLTLFDNRDGVNARTVAMTLDLVSGTATIDEVHTLHRRCTIQGSNFVLASGNVVATCGSTKEIFEFEGGVDEDPLWSMAIDATVIEVARGIPITDLPPGW